jgi:hypothetical protein
MRYRGQHGRRAFGPGRKVSHATLARYIADSIRQHAAVGAHREVTHYTQDVGHPLHAGCRPTTARYRAAATGSSVITEGQATHPGRLSTCPSRIPFQEGDI